VLEIPLTSDGEQKFSMTLDEVLYDFRVSYNTRLNLWSMDISLLGVDLVNGVALVVGADIMGSYNVGPKNLFVVNTESFNEDAKEDNLGTAVRLFQLTDEEVSSVSAI